MEVYIMAKEFGYCSSGCTRPQFEKQIDNINSRYPNAIIIKEVYSSKVSDRTELHKLLSQLENGDILIINSLDRLSRDSEEVLSYYKILAERGVKLIFLHQPYMNTEVYASAYEDMMQGKSISSYNSYAYDRFTLELRYPFLLGNTTIYGLAFAEGGNAWSRPGKFNPFDMKRSAGVGVRIYLPMVGLMGIDWAYGFDYVTTNQNGARSKGGSNFHFILGQEF